MGLATLRAAGEGAAVVNNVQDPSGFAESQSGILIPPDHGLASMDVLECRADGPWSLGTRARQGAASSPGYIQPGLVLPAWE